MSRFQVKKSRRARRGCDGCANSGYLLDSDVIVAHKDELLYVAIYEAVAMSMPAAWFLRSIS